MPVYNCRAYLDDAIESVLEQTLDDFEFIVVDDGSTDGSRERLAEWEQKDSRIRLLVRSHLGVTRALNEALFSARGIFVGRMDADDISEPDRLRRQVVFLHENPDIVAVGTATLFIDEDGLPEIGRAHV